MAYPPPLTSWLWSEFSGCTRHKLNLKIRSSQHSWEAESFGRVYRECIKWKPIASLVDLTWGENVYIPEQTWVYIWNLETLIWFKGDTAIWKTKTKGTIYFRYWIWKLNPLKRTLLVLHWEYLVFSLWGSKHVRDVNVARNQTQTLCHQQKAGLSLATRGVSELEASSSPGDLRWLQLANAWVPPIKAHLNGSENHM